MWVLALGLLRLVSEKPICRNSTKKGTHMTKHSTSGIKTRNYLQYLSETLWAVGAGALVGPLAS